MVRSICNTAYLLFTKYCAYLVANCYILLCVHAAGIICAVKCRCCICNSKCSKLRIKVQTLNLKVEFFKIPSFESGRFFTFVDLVNCFLKWYVNCTFRFIFTIISRIVQKLQSQCYAHDVIVEVPNKKWTCKLWDICINNVSVMRVSVSEIWIKILVYLVTECSQRSFDRALDK